MRRIAMSLVVLLTAPASAEQPGMPRVGPGAAIPAATEPKNISNQRPGMRGAEEKTAPAETEPAAPVTPSPPTIDLGATDQDRAPRPADKVFQVAGPSTVPATTPAAPPADLPVPAKVTVTAPAPAPAPDTAPATIPAPLPATAPTTAPATAPTVIVEEVAPDQEPDARVTFTADHLSGLYYAKEEGQIEVLVELPPDAAEPMQLHGAIDFLAIGGKDAALSVTPIADATVKPGQRVKMVVPVKFPAPGEYQLRLNGDKIAGAGGVELRCIFAPRGADAKTPSPWIEFLPRAAARVPGFLADYVKRTGTRRFLLDESWGPRLTPDVKVHNKGQRAILLANIEQAKAQLVLRLSLSADARADSRHIAALNRYVSAFAAQAKTNLAAISLDAGDAALSGDDLERYRDYYLAAYDGAKKQNKKVLMLGAGSFQNTSRLLVAPPKGESLRKYVDVLAVDPDPADIVEAQQRVGGKEWANTPVWVLPDADRRVAPAFLCGKSVAVIPLFPDERNVPAHLLGGAAPTENLLAHLYAYTSIFQGDGFAVAAIGGRDAIAWRQSATTAPVDTRPAQLEIREAGKVIAAPFLEVADDTQSMRVVDARGNPVDCRFGDTLKIPLTGTMLYLLASGDAGELTGLLRTAAAHGLPPISATVKQLTAPTAAEPGKALLALTGLTAAPTAAEIALVDAAGQTLGEPQKIAALKLSAQTEITLSIPPNAAPAFIEVRTKSSVASYKIAAERK